MRQECTDWTYSREPINATISADQWVEAGLAEVLPPFQLPRLLARDCPLGSAELFLVLPKRQ